MDLLKKIFIRQLENDAPADTASVDPISDFNEHYSMPYTKEDMENGKTDPNILLGEGLKLSLYSENVEQEYRRNTNILVVGGSGSGKTTFYVKPNIIQYNSSIVCVDPYGEIMASTGKGLLKNGYELHLFSISDMLHSNVFNPLDYIYTYDNAGNKIIDEFAVSVLVNTLMENINDDGHGIKDPFWEKATKVFLTFLIYYLGEFLPPQDRNLYKLYKMIQLGRCDEKTGESPLDKVVAKSRKTKPDAKCFFFYDMFKLASSKTVNAILIALGVNLAPFGVNEKLKNLTTTDYLCERDKETGEITEYIKDKEGSLIPTSRNIDFKMLGDRKTALFINCPQARGIYGFLVAMFYSTMFMSLYDRAERVCSNSWNIHDRTGAVIGANYSTEKEAERYRELYSTASIKEETETNGHKHYYIYNKAASLEESMKEKAYLPAGMGGGTGYLREMYDKDYAENFIKHFKDAEINKGSVRLPVPVNVYMDEFINMGKVKDLDKILATCRKYRISITVIVQATQQLAAMYGEQYEFFPGNCDSTIILGSSERETDKYITERLGKTTIKVKGEIPPATRRRRRNGRNQELFNGADIDHRINHEYSLVLVRGVDKPLLVKKIDYFHHPNFESTGDHDKKNMIDKKFLEEYFSVPQQKCKEKETKEGPAKENSNLS